MAQRKTSLDTIRLWIKEATDVDYYDLMWTLQLIMSGNKRAIDAAMKGGVLRASGAAYQAGGDLPLYPKIAPGMGSLGQQNHNLINARINANGLVMNPEATFVHPDPYIRRVNAAYIFNRWQRQDWSTELYRTAMEVEANGISGLSCGITKGRVNWRHQPILHTLWDRSRETDWRWVCERRLLCPEDVEDIYGSAVTSEDIKNLVVMEGKTEAFKGTRSERNPRRIILVYDYWSEDEHVVFLGSVQGGNSIALRMNPSKGMRYEKTTTNAGPNPFGVQPHAWWIDSWCPGVERPVGKLQTTTRLSSMLNAVERLMTETVRNGPALTLIDSQKMHDPTFVDKMLNAKNPEEMDRLIVTNGDVSEAIKRIPAEQLPPIYLQMRAVYKEEINASTGVQDMQRGQALGGERRTRYEVENLVASAGVQAQHMRRRYAACITDLIQVTRVIGAQWDTGKEILIIPDMDPLDPKIFPLAPFLSVELATDINPESLIFKSEEQLNQQLMLEFQTVLTPAMELQVADPVKVFSYVLRKLGHRNPDAEFGLRSPAPPPVAGPGQDPNAMPPEGAPQPM